MIGRMNERVEKACTDQRWAQSGPQGWTAFTVAWRRAQFLWHDMANVEIVFDARRTWEPGFEKYLWEAPSVHAPILTQNATCGSHFSCPTTLDYQLIV